MMSGTEWMVLLGGVAAIVWVNWYFFLAASTTTPATKRAGEGKEES